MSVSSMTGFARASGVHEGHGWTWEVKSVNGRGLEVRLRLPAGFERLEPAARARIAAHLKRGNVQAQLVMTRPEGEAAVRVNRALIDRLIDLQAEIGGRIDPAPPRLDALLAVRGVIEPAEGDAELPEAADAREAAVMAGLEEAMGRLVAARREEGGRLAPVLESQLDDIGALCRAATDSAAAQPAAIKTRLEERLRELLEGEPSLSEDRLAQEVVLLAARADVREELDRLAAHLAAARALLSEGGAIGRRLDFLCQELNREVNTLCSKAADIELTNVGLGLKAAVEQLREQVQNIE